eukprot:365296-Chlamydomonas_euryale.AAC.25
MSRPMLDGESSTLDVPSSCSSSQLLKPYCRKMRALSLHASDEMACMCTHVTWFNSTMAAFMCTCCL